MPDLARRRTIAVFGGIYNNWLALQALLEDAERRGASSLYCLGDMGGFGPHPDRVFPLLRERPEIYVMQGNYDHSIGNRLEDCACGYTDPRDNHFAQISYEYTAAHTSQEHKDWLRDLPTEFRLELAGRPALMAHGSPRRVNEFLWESTSPDPFLERLLDEAGVDLLFVTHTGVPWRRRLAGGRQVVNVGAIGRPANRGALHVDYALVTERAGELTIELVALDYDYERLARELEAEGLPREFAATLRSGYWTTCLEILPAKERARGIY